MSLLPLTGPRWVVVRQHHRALWTALTLVAAAVVVWAGLRRWALTATGFPACVRGDYESCSLAGTTTTPWEVTRLAMEYASGALVAVPFIAGAFVAGPMIARELESGTYKVAWTQSVTPARWLASKLAVAAVMTATGSALLVLGYRYGWSPFRDTFNLGWSERGVYEAIGPVLVAYALLAVAVAAVAGQLVRRTVPAMAVTAAVTGAVLLVLGQLRWRLWPEETLIQPGAKAWGDMGPLPRDAHLLDSGFLTASGGRLPYDVCRLRTGTESCPADLHVTASYTDYHPASHFWPLQLIETGIVLALATAATYAAFRLLRRDHA
ncbi:ABC transporter permease [Streptomyces sp. NPDC006368]|uniref:ABC transporter permease n=1 Tax=Streptomyces sp. NPDC006368 TaxID=3156760 RepID=UPI0033AF2E75